MLDLSLPLLALASALTSRLDENYRFVKDVFFLKIFIHHTW